MCFSLINWQIVIWCYHLLWTFLNLSFDWLSANEVHEANKCIIILFQNYLLHYEYTVQQFETDMNSQRNTTQIKHKCNTPQNFPLTNSPTIEVLNHSFSTHNATRWHQLQANQLVHNENHTRNFTSNYNIYKERDKIVTKIIRVLSIYKIKNSYFCLR